MAASKFGAKLHKSTHKIVVVLVYALLEWVLITLLLFNSMFYYLIKKFASFFGLKPTCLWCSSVDSLFEPGKKDGSYEGIFCEDHTSQISNLGYCLSHKKLAKTQNRCQECSNINGVDTASEDGIEKELACSCCEKSFRSDVPPHLMISGLLDVVPKERLRTEEGCNMSNEEPQILSDVGSLNLQEAAEEDSSLCNEDEEDTCDVEVEPTEDISSSADHLTAANDQFHHESVLTETSDSCNSDLKNQDLAIRYDEGLLIGNETSDDHPGEKHKEEVRSMLGNGGNEEGKIDDPGLVIEQLRSELESERSAAAIAANQTMAMITRLQEEKAAIKMEAVQYQRMMEEQAEYDQEALQLLNELVIKREKEKQELEKELREKVLEYEGIRKRGCSSSSCSLSDDSEKLSIDLSREIGEDSLPSTGAVLDSVDLVLDRVKNWNMLDGSLEEFEQERVSILHQLKELEEKLFSICDDDQEQQLLFEDVKPIENADLCSAEVNLGPPSGCLAMEKDHPSTMCSAAKKLLPFLDDKASLREVDTSDQVVAIIKEMDHVYGRLQALEADREFLRQCIASLNKGDKGVRLLEEILQHLRELRNADTCHLMICNTQESSFLHNH